MNSKVKIAMIGAGSVGFCKLLVQDILTFKSMHNAHVCLMDIHQGRLELAKKVMDQMKRQNNLECTFSMTLDRREAVREADFVISMIQVGGLEAYAMDVEIPLSYGVDQCVGDTINPGGLFRGLRHVPALFDILTDMREVSKPDVIMLNYANPMAICTWAIQQEFPDIQSVGLCHGVQHTTNMLCQWLGINSAEVNVYTAGINHMAWFLKFSKNGEDLYPRLWDKLNIEGAVENENYRFEMMKATNYFMTESSGHLSEYLPYFRHRSDLHELFSGPGFGGETAGNLRGLGPYYKEYEDKMNKWASGQMPVEYSATERSVEFASHIMNAKLTGQITRFFGNVLNTGGLISNLPEDACVEVPIFVDKFGFNPVRVGRLPDHCAALCNSNISMQRLAVKAAIESDLEAVYQACLLDPLTAATLAPHEIRNMVDEMIVAEKQWLPNFVGKTNNSPGYSIDRIQTGLTKLKKVSKLQHSISFHDDIQNGKAENKLAKV